MSSLFPIFKHIDNFFFDLVDRYMSSALHQQIINRVSHLEGSVQTMLNHLFTVIFLVIPIFLCMIFFITNISIENTYDVNLAILETIKDIEANKKKFSSLSRQILSPSTITTGAQLKQKIDSILNIKKIDESKVKITTSKLGHPTQGLSSFDSDINFNRFTITDLADFLTALLDQEKMNITNLNIIRKKNKTLDGDFHLVHFSKQLKQSQ
ncbi:MAG: hypothetical protein ISR65_06205 [Bacteriovoracaceae bacterium]|nr:hypothetical protein [Bacteriovoracaceae bacterium]